MLRWCATHWRPASIFLRLCSRNDFASPSANFLRAPCNPTAATPIQHSFHAFPSIPLFFNIVIVTCYYTIPILCFYGNFYRRISFSFFFFFFFSFKFLSFGSVCFIDLQFLTFFSSYSFLYPGNAIWMCFVRSVVKTFVRYKEI